ncbi:hypothetical protein GPECTOR_2g1194 [Gonium pectorale]|uniref:Uncharacterized protein n=1 Tax=Gonium pectorale TaxID=33097 RepID=A0A150H0T2_GONPE|nr:hypothetical protein GPECTOR_2g1194 [Gonium pectorale]|eukprot:KXZ55644.1 hypothetical protein GPECTOR_2g1194 [Gonium pectorale]
MRKEREVAWKHEQNRLMRQRQRSLEEQNELLNRLLNEQLERTSGAAAPYPEAQPAVMLASPYVNMLLGQRVNPVDMVYVPSGQHMQALQPRTW